MSEWLASATGALWLGVLTSVSPCLLATNAAAIAFLLRRAATPKGMMLSCAAYMAGQALAFVLLAALILTSALSVPVLSHWLQKYMFRLLGPLLILSALLILRWVELPALGGRLKAWAQARAEGGGAGASLLLGTVFALSFCPTTAALFFGSLLPLAIAQGSPVGLPLIYALGVALPVVLLSMVLGAAAGRAGKVFAGVGAFDRVARNGTGAIFLVIGVYFTLVYTLELLGTAP